MQNHMKLNGKNGRMEMNMSEKKSTKKTKFVEKKEKKANSMEKKWEKDHSKNKVQDLDQSEKR